MPTYSFMNINASIVGPGAVIALGNGAAVSEEGISISQAEDKNVLVVGADGRTMNTLRAGKSGSITIRLLQTSPTNAKLMAMYDAQSLSSTLWGQNVITISNTGPGDVTGARNVAFKKKPDIVYSKDGKMLEWVFDAGEIDTVLGTY